MKQVKKIEKLLHKKYELFLEYERATEALLVADADSAEQYITKRTEIATAIDTVDERVAELSNDFPDRELLMESVRAKPAYEDVPKAYRGLFEQGQQIRSVVYRLMDADQRIVERLEAFKEEALEKIKDNKSLPQIKKYMNGLSDTSSGSFRNSKA